MDSLGIDFSAGVKRGTAAIDIFRPVHPAGLKQRCSELLANSLGTKPEGRNLKSRNAGRKPKLETRQPFVRRAGLWISGFFRTSDFGLRIYAVSTVSIFV